FVSTLWRIRRIPKLEQAFLAWSHHKRYWEDSSAALDVLNTEEFGFKSKPALLPPNDASQHQRATDEFTSTFWPGVDDRELHLLKIIGRAVEDACCDANVLTKLSAYEARLLRQLDNLTAQLERLKEIRMSQGPKAQEVVHRNRDVQ